MKVLLVNPPYKVFPGSDEVKVFLPLGLLYLAAILEQADCEVEILDALLDCQRPRQEEDGLVYGMPWQDIESEIRHRQPDLVGITNPFTPQIENALAVAHIVKKINPSLPTVIGGPHPTAQYGPLLKECSDVDVVVIGEGELTIVDLARAYSTGGDLSGVKGIAYRKGRKIMVNHPREFIANLDVLPLPAYHLLDMERYFHLKGRRYRAPGSHAELPMITSRGCPFNCVFCCVHARMGRKWRAHSAEYVINHIDFVLNKYGVQHIHFDDDNLTLDINRFDRILNGLQERELRFSWNAIGLRADRLTLPLLQKMKDCGSLSLGIGIESGEQEVLDNIIGKHLRLEDVVKVADMCHKAGVELFGYYVIGFPGESKENMQKTVDFALWLKSEYNVCMNLHIATPFYGSRLHKICEDKGYLTRKLTPRPLAEALQTCGRGLIKTPDFDPEDVKRIALQAMSSYRWLRLRNYLRHPITAMRKALLHRADAVLYLKSLVRS